MASLLLPCGTFFLVGRGRRRRRWRRLQGPGGRRPWRPWVRQLPAVLLLPLRGGSMAGVSPSGAMAAGPLLPPRHHRRRLLLPFPGGALELATVAPAVAGATLLALGNGAPDFFASVVSFAAGGRAADEVGLSSVLGGAFFVSTVVVGVISVAVGGGAVTVAVDRFCFLRDLCFLAAALCSLTAVLAIGRINLWGAIFFLSLYFVYVLAISTTACCRRSPLEGLSASLLAGEEEKEDLEGGAREEPKSPRRRGWWRSLLAAPLHLPRRLTIPVVSEERWSKPFAVASAALSRRSWRRCGPLGARSSSSPAACWVSSSAVPPWPPQRDPFRRRAAAAAMVGSGVPDEHRLGVPRRRRAGSASGFLGPYPRDKPICPRPYRPSLGNSLGDLTANVAMAVYGGAPGAQVAFSGCYAGPIFNTLVGLGISLLFSAWWSHPSSFPVPAENSSYQLLGFMAAGLLWAAVILTRREMKVDRFWGSACSPSTVPFSPLGFQTASAGCDCGKKTTT
ncbi:unnamed protein product [Spirodela intermedia]|uniref:Sodium/calcium exchanger membrane region domain-containing protein n=1 Tax=Spirodela intermedia TaxID=51605 RepID=A0A7I8IY62_SPIIN|nr:unnamed protein product [Spirodela intermedia]CAA6662807.1 unnamed protein product [Spirodela intermedia]